jgi:hypothetical protein
MRLQRRAWSKARLMDPEITHKSCQTSFRLYNQHLLLIQGCLSALINNAAIMVLVFNRLHSG